MKEMNETGVAQAAVEAAYNFVFNDFAKGDRGLLFYGGLSLWGLVVFWGVGSLFTILDLTNPAWAVRFKIQPTVNVPLDKEKFWRGVRLISFNQFIIVPCFAIALGQLVRLRGNPYLPEDMYWDAPRLLKDFLIIIICEEIGFFYSHKWCHEFSFLYKHIHKIHHEWTAPIAIAAVYAHPLEHIICNLGPIAMGPLVSGCHVWEIFLWVSVAITTTLISHSGYHFPFLASPEKHDFHHKQFNVNYGVLGILDRLYGTDARFRKDICSKRDKILLSFTPMREQFPDVGKVSKSE